LHSSCLTSGTIGQSRPAYCSGTRSCVCQYWYVRKSRLPGTDCDLLSITNYQCAAWRWAKIEQGVEATSAPSSVQLTDCETPREAPAGCAASRSLADDILLCVTWLRNNCVATSSFPMHVRERMFSGSPVLWSRSTSVVDRQGDGGGMSRIGRRYCTRQSSII
jgi:hypothetical protein